MHCVVSRCRSSLALVVVAGTALAVAGAVGGAQPPQTSPEPGRVQPEPGRPSQPGGPRPQQGEPRNVEGAMKLINRSLRTLNRQIDDTAKKAENLKLVGDAERGAVLAKGMEPEKAPKDGREEYLKKFRLKQIELIGMLLELETDIVNDKTAEAKAVMAKLATFRDSTHKSFDVEEDADGKGWAGGRGPGRESGRPEDGKK